MSIKDVVYAVAKGTFDSIKGIYWLFTLDSMQKRAHNERTQFHELRRTNRTTIHVNKEEPRLLKRVLQCCSLNGLVFAASVLTFNKLVLPLLKLVLTTLFDSTTDLWYWLELCLQLTFGTLWIIPLYILSGAVNSLWFQDIGTLAYRYSIGRPKGLPNLSSLVADNLFSILIQLFFLIQAKAVLYIPIPVLNEFLFLFHMCLFYSLYSFEYKWIQMGWPLHQRLSYLESNWPYFLGFGLPLTLVTWWPNDFVISGCCFSIVFPLFIISGNEADAVVVNGNRRLQLFSLVVGVSNTIFKKSVRPPPPPSQLPPNRESINSRSTGGQPRQGRTWTTEVPVLRPRVTKR